MFTPRLAVLTLFVGSLAACGTDAPSAPNSLARARGTADAPARAAVYTATNAASGNAVLVFARAVDGSLAAPVVVPTGGVGTGISLDNQGGLALSDDGRRLAVVNAGSDDVSVFDVGAAGLSLVARVPSGGDRPISVALHDDLLYVINEGSAAIAGFRLDATGTPAPIAKSVQPLSTAGVDAAQVSFSPDGRQLVVTEKSTSLLLVFPVGADGVALPAVAHPSAGPTPFGFAFGLRGTLVVSEAFGGAADGSATSSYLLGADGALRVASASVSTTETAACWIAVTRDGRHAYASNAGSATITGYGIAPSGTLTRLDADGVSATTPAGTTDLALSQDDRFLYSLNGSSGTISAFRVEASGALTAIGTTTLPANANGLAAR